MKDAVLVTYRMETEESPERAAQRLAEEQSLGSQGRREYAAQVEEVKQEAGATQAVIAYPSSNVENDLAALITTVIGEIHNIKGMEIRVEDITFPDALLGNWYGPHYGVNGIRNLVQVHDRPLLCGPVKPCVGLTPEEFAQRAYEAWIGGIDIVKDDELLFDPKYCKLEERVKRTLEKCEQARAETGEKKLYIVNIGGTHLEQHLETAREAHGVLIIPAVNGLSIAQKVHALDPGKIIFGHNAVFYASSREPYARVDFSVWIKLQRIAGIDVMLVPAPYGSFEVMTPEAHTRNSAACLGNLGNIKPIFPAISGSQGADTIAKHYQEIGNDFVCVVGKKVYDHPDGVSAGARELRCAAEQLKR